MKMPENIFVITVGGDSLVNRCRESIEGYAPVSENAKHNADMIEASLTEAIGQG